MKKLLFLGIFAFLSCSICTVSIAETVGNPIDINLPPGKGVFSAQLSDFVTLNIGVDSEFLLSKKFDNKNEGSTDQKLSGEFYMGKLSCTLFERIQPYVTFGGANLVMKWNDGDTPVKLQTAIAPSMGAGIKAYLWEFEGMGIKIFSTASMRITKPKRLKSASSVDSIDGAVVRDKFELIEKQATLGISREFFLFGLDNVSMVPYIGAVWSDSIARVRFTKGERFVSSGANGQKQNLGLFLGTDFIVMDNLSLNVEGRIGDEQSVSAGFTALF